MPLLHVVTSVKEADIPADFLADMNQTWQTAIGKPMKYISVHLVPNQLMMFGGTTEPCAIVNVTSIGKLGLEENKVLTKTISDLLAKIGIMPDRMYVIFNDAAPQNVGWNGTTFAK